MSRGLRRALVLSIAFHLLVFGTVETGGRLGWWRHSPLRNWLVTSVSERQASALAQARARAEAERQQDPPLLFLEVDPSQAAPEAPEKALYYAANNSRAANPDISKATPTPKVDGNQEKVARTRTVPRRLESPPKALQPAAPSTPQPQAEPQPQQPAVASTQPVQPSPARTEVAAPSETALRPGDVLVAKPAPESQSVGSKGEAQAAAAASPRRERPRTIAQARAQAAEDSPSQASITGEKMKQAGGVQRFGVESSLDARATSYGAYDAAVVAAIQHRWYMLLDERSFAFERSGKVVLDFKMKHDGTVHDMKVVSSDVGEILTLVCQKAILDPSPFGVWPRQMRIELGDIRDVRFTFHYN